MVILSLMLSVCREMLAEVSYEIWVLYVSREAYFWMRRVYML